MNFLLKFYWNNRHMCILDWILESENIFTWRSVLLQAAASCKNTLAGTQPWWWWWWLQWSHTVQPKLFLNLFSIRSFLSSPSLKRISLLWACNTPWHWWDDPVPHLQPFLLPRLLPLNGMKTTASDRPRSRHRLHPTLLTTLSQSPGSVIAVNIGATVRRR